MRLIFRALLSLLTIAMTLLTALVLFIFISDLLEEDVLTLVDLIEGDFDVIDLGDLSDAPWDTIAFISCPTLIEGYSMDELNTLEEWRELRAFRDIPLHFVILFRAEGAIIDHEIQWATDVTFQIDESVYQGYGYHFELVRGESAFERSEMDDGVIFTQINDM
ncbi:MAG: hypothetical protein ACOYI5_02790 [Christensenellales bacterium]